MTSVSADVAGGLAQARARRALVRLAIRWSVIVAGVALWQFGAAKAANPYFPPPAAIATRMRAQWLSGPARHLWLSADAVANVLPSVARMLVGLGIATAAGVALGVLLGRSERAHDYAGPLLRLARATPPATLVPVFIALFHLGARMEVATIAFGACWPILANTIDGASSIDATQVETALVYRLGVLGRLRCLILPAILPKVFAGLRVSLALALILMILSELVGGTDGIGYTLANAQQSYDLPGLWACVVLTGLLGYAGNAALLAVERRLLVWRG